MKNSRGEIIGKHLDERCQNDFLCNIPEQIKKRFFNREYFCNSLMSCTGICGRFKASKPTTGGRYQAGQKRCNTCNIFIETDGLFCPCCNLRLRSNSRYTKYKEKFLDIQRI